MNVRAPDRQADRHHRSLSPGNGVRNAPYELRFPIPIPTRLNGHIVRDRERCAVVVAGSEHQPFPHQTGLLFDSASDSLQEIGVQAEKIHGDDANGAAVVTERDRTHVQIIVDSGRGHAARLDHFHPDRWCDHRLRYISRDGHGIAARGGTRRRTESGEALGWQGATNEHMGICERGATQPAGMDRRSNAVGVSPRADSAPASPLSLSSTPRSMTRPASLWNRTTPHAVEGRQIPLIDCP